MDQELQNRLDAQDQKLAAIQKSIDQMRRYFLWTLVITVAVIVLPLIGLAVVILWFMSVMGQAYQGLL